MFYSHPHFLVFWMMFLMSLIAFISTYIHTLTTLIALEFMALSIFFMLSTLSLLLPMEAVSSFFYLSIAVCEGALGLSILVLFSRSSGNDLLEGNSFLLC